MKIRVLACVGGVLSLMAVAASAEPFNLTRATSGYLYFNKPGADMARHDGELKNCAENWGGGIHMGGANNQVTVVGARNVAGGVAAGVIGSLIADGIQDKMMSGWDAARKQINIEHCMIVKGWRLVRLPDDEGEKLAQLPQKDLAAALAPYVAADQPKGEVVRTWQNEQIYVSTIVARSPQNSDRHLLSADAVSPDTPALDGITSLDPARHLQGLKMRSNAFWGLKTMKLSEATVPGPGQSLLVFAMHVMKKDRHASTFIERADPNDPMSPNYFGLSGGNDYVTQSDASFLAYRAILVPSGTWFVSGNYPNMDNCLGTPSFEAADGAAVYLGTFDLTQDKISVSTDTAAVDPLLAGKGIKLAPAHWINGYTYPCRQLAMYALEYEGFPFAPGYHWGSQAHPRP